MLLMDKTEAEQHHDIRDALCPPAEILPLPCDFIIYGRSMDKHLVEHVTASGLIQDIETRRLEYEKIPKMMAENPTTMTLLVDGVPEYLKYNGKVVVDEKIETDWNLKSLYGFRLRFKEQFGITMEWVFDWVGVAEFVKEMLAYYNEPHDYTPPPRPLPMDMDGTKNKYLFFLCGIKPDGGPGIDVVKATNILKLAASRKDSPAGVCAWTQETWKSVEKIGDKTSKLYHDWLTTPITDDKIETVIKRLERRR